MRTLVAGWFSFRCMGATAGDLLARNLVCEWLTQAGQPWDVAVAPPFPGGVDWRSVDPDRYARVVFVCGPFPHIHATHEFVERFARCRILGVNLSMTEPLEFWNPFDALFERDSPVGARPDVTFLTPPARVPVVGVILVGPQPEYGERGMHRWARTMIDQLVNSREMAVVKIDTRLDVPNEGGLRSAAEVETLIGRMDLVVTTRLHGTVLALKQGVPAIAIDPIAGGAKIRRQVETIGWPVVFDVESLSQERLAEAFDYCLTEEAGALARSCRDGAHRQLAGLREAFLAEVASAEAPDRGRAVPDAPPESPSRSAPSKALRVHRVLRAARSAARRILRA